MNIFQCVTKTNLMRLVETWQSLIMNHSESIIISLVLYDKQHTLWLYTYFYIWKALLCFYVSDFLVHWL